MACSLPCVRAIQSYRLLFTIFHISCQTFQCLFISPRLQSSVHEGILCHYPLVLQSEHLKPVRSVLHALQMALQCRRSACSPPKPLTCNSLAQLDVAGPARPPIREQKRAVNGGRHTSPRNELLSKGGRERSGVISTTQDTLCPYSECTQKPLML